MDTSPNDGGLWYGQLTTALVAGVALVFFAAVSRSLFLYLRIIWAIWYIPGPPAYPVIGNALMFQGSILKFFEVLRDCHQKYGNLFRLWFGPYPTVYLCGAEEVKPFLRSSIHIEKSSEYGQLDSWLGKGLLTSGGKKWHMRRKLLTGAFHNTVLESYVSSLDKVSDMLVSKINSLISETNPYDWSKGIDVVPITKLSALDAICETIMGVNVKALEGSDNMEYVSAIHRTTLLIILRFVSPWLRSDFIFNRSSVGKEYNKCVDVIHKFTENVIKERKEEFKALKGSSPTKDDKGLRRQSFLDLLLDLSNNGKVLSDEDINEEVNTFMFAGHDTTAAAINWSLFVLGNKPEIQERILEENRSILGEGADRKLTINYIGKLDYLDRYIKEVLRMYPTVPLIGRELLSPLTIKGHTFPAGTSFTISPFLLHRDPTYFPEPETFNPDRFIDFEKNNPHPFAYAPFSAGSRNCIGQKFAILELKVTLLKILENFEIRSMQSMEDMVIQSEVVLNSPDGIKIAFRKRRK